MWQVYTFPWAPLHIATLSPDLCIETHTYQMKDYCIGALLSKLYCSKHKSVRTCCVVFVVVYDIRYGAEGVFLSQEELSGVIDFDLVMFDIAAGTACAQATREKSSSVYRQRFTVAINSVWDFNCQFGCCDVM